MRTLDPSRTIRLNNTTCPYCGITHTESRRTEEHVIGRRFVPKGSLQGQWNLILWACSSCNGRKAQLEDDISAISLQPDAAGRYADAGGPRDDRLRREALRKGRRSVSRRTARPVGASAERLRFSVPIGQYATLKGDFTSPPQVDDERVAELALLHCRAFFYWVTYDDRRSAGRTWCGAFRLVNATLRTDWGSSLMRSFMETVHAWEPRVMGLGAEDQFGVAIRKHPTHACWSWAVEWNRNLRAIGFFGDDAVADSMARSLGWVPPAFISRGPNHLLAFRLEFALPPEDDLMFDWVPAAERREC